MVVKFDVFSGLQNMGFPANRQQTQRPIQIDDEKYLVLEKI